MTTDQTSAIHIQGDVDRTIETDQSVKVDGSVRAGLRICARGDVRIEGGVETGVRMDAEGDVIIVGGMVGAATTIVG